jgi:site-specific recombinase XerD
MPLKRQLKAREIPIFDNAYIHQRGDYWQLHMWLEREGKYARKSLRTRSQSTAVERAKRLYMEISAHQLSGKTYFSLTVKQGVAQYLAARERDVQLGLITRDRYITLRSQLKHWQEFIGRETRLKELDTEDCEDYFQYRNRISDSKVKNLTVQHEQSTINQCVRWLHKRGETEIDGFEFRKLPRVDRGNEAVRRATLTGEEYEQLCAAMRMYCIGKKGGLDTAERLQRQLVQHYVLIAATSGLRVGEQLQLRWSDVEIETHRDKQAKPIQLARIHVRAKTSKVRRSRIFLCRSAEYFAAWRRLVGHQSSDALVFSIDGRSAITKRALLYHFKRMVESAGIRDLVTRDIVPYSLRHYMITQRIMSGVDFRAIADMCDTSITQIE